MGYRQSPILMRPIYWDSTQTAEYLGIKLNNLRQITLRMTRDHLMMGHRNDKCSHLIVDHRGLGKSWYKAETVLNYSLVRKGQVNPMNKIIRQTRDERKRSTRKAGLTVGRPSVK